MHSRISDACHFPRRQNNSYCTYCIYILPHRPSTSDWFDRQQPTNSIRSRGTLMSIEVLFVQTSIFQSLGPGRSSYFDHTRTKHAPEQFVCVIAVILWCLFDPRWCKQLLHIINWNPGKKMGACESAWCSTNFSNTPTKPAITDTTRERIDARNIRT